MLAKKICVAEHPKEKEQQLPRTLLETVPELFKHELGNSGRPMWLELVNKGQSTRRKFSELRSGVTCGFTLRNHWGILLSRAVTSDLQLRWRMTEVGHGQKQEHKKPPQ